MVNQHGKRFVDEGEDMQFFTYAKFGRAILGQPGGKVYQIFDAKTVHLLESRYANSDPLRAPVGQRFDCRGDPALVRIAGVAIEGNPHE